MNRRTKDPIIVKKKHRGSGAERDKTDEQRYREALEKIAKQGERLNLYDYKYIANRALKGKDT